MATSGTQSWELDRDDIIEAAYRKLGVPGEGNTLSATQTSDGGTALNSVVALAQTDGMPLWKRTTSTQTPSTTSQVYTLANAVKIAAVYLRDSGGTQYELENKSLYDFNRLPRNSVGVPVSWTWAPSVEGGTVSIWPLTSDSNTVSSKTIVIVYQKEFDDFTASGNTPDFPSYWTLALIYQTAAVLAPEQGVPLPDRQEINKLAQLYWAQASAYGDEGGSLFVQPEKRW